MMDRPPRGTQCAPCREEHGHFCEAVLYIDVGKPNRVPMCFACADDEPCAVMLKRGSPMPVATPAQEMARKEEEMTVTSGRRPGQRIPEEIKDQIRTAPDDVTNVELARRFGISDVSVSAIRKQEAGIRRPGPRHRNTNALATATTVRSIEVDPSRPGSADALIRALDGQGKNGNADRFTVSLELTRADVHRMVDSMTTDQLAELVQRRIGAAAN